MTKDRTHPPNRYDRGLLCLSSKSCDEETAVSTACGTCKNLVWPEILLQNESLLRRNDADCSIRRNFRQISSRSTRSPCQKGDAAFCDVCRVSESSAKAIVWETPRWWWRRPLRNGDWVDLHGRFHGNLFAQVQVLMECGHVFSDFLIICKGTVAKSVRHF